MINHWEHDEIQYLKDNLMIKDVKEVANHLNRSERAVIVYAWENGIPRKTKITWRPWTKKDEEYLIKNWPTKNIQVMIEQLGRTESAMRSRVHYLKDRIKNPKPVQKSKPKPLTMGEKAYNEILEAQRRYHAKEKEKMGIEVCQ